MDVQPFTMSAYGRPRGFTGNRDQPTMTVTLGILRSIRTRVLNIGSRSSTQRPLLRLSDFNEYLTRYFNHLLFMGSPFPDRMLQA